MSKYVVKEYNDLADEENELLYDANGNIIADFDRNICTIQYNLLNLPAIIQFCDGNSIRNVYNAEGVKLSSTYLTLPETMVVPVGTVLPVEDMPQGVHVLVRQYLGHVDKTITDSTTAYIIHHAEGYVTCDSLYASPVWHYLYHDHLGNNVAVWNATADTVVQRMCYYPSGLPMAVSIGQGAQPYKYNGKEYDEMHGYDVYDYGFRGYYASIARFTSIDPLCENTPWQSPYCYASNNFTGEIDWMGLSTGGGYTTSDPEKIAALLSYLATGGALKDYNTDGWVNITEDVMDLVQYSHNPSLFDIYFTYAGPGGIGEAANMYVITTSKKGLNTYDQQLYSDISTISKKSLEATSTLVNTWMLEQLNPFWWYGANGRLYTYDMIHKRGGYANSFKRAGIRLKASPIGRASSILSVLSVVAAIYDMSENGINASNSINLAMSIVSLTGPVGILVSTCYGVVDLTITDITGISLSDWVDVGIGYVINEYIQP